MSIRHDELKRLGVAVGGDPKETVELYCLAQELGVEEKFLELLRRNEDFGSIRTYLFLEDMSRVLAENKKLRVEIWELQVEVRNIQAALTHMRCDFNELASEVLRMDMARLRKEIKANDTLMERFATRVKGVECWRMTSPFSKPSTTSPPPSGGEGIT